MTRRRWILLAALAVLVAGWALLLPPEARSLGDGAGLPSVVRGTIHVHTRRSDGTGTVDDVAAAAARAGLKFVIITDHGDATREPDPPAYRGGVLCIDAVEISTDNGHVVALGLPRVAYPLAGEGRDVVEDIARLGGMSIVAHPGSPKPELRWTEWAAPFDGLEWLNGDSEWRDEEPAALARALLTYPLRPSAAVGRLLDRPESVLQRWNVLATRRPVVAVAAGDAHARIGLRGAGDPYRGSAALHIPAYEQVFRAFSIALPSARLTGNATEDARSVVDAIRAGHVYSSVDSLAGPALLSFSGRSGTSRVEGGDTLSTVEPVALRVASNAPPEARVAILKNGAPVAMGNGASLEYSTSAEPAAYRVEIHLPDAPGDPAVPWVVSNPIYVRAPVKSPQPVSGRPLATVFAAQYENGSPTGWRVEKSDLAQSALDVVAAVGGTQLLLRYALGGAAEDGPFVALAMPAAQGLASFDRVMFTVRAARPMRLSVQMRVPHDGRDERWRRSVYVEEMPRTVTVFFDEMTPIGATTRRRPVLGAVRDVLFVVDTVNNKPGTSGQVWLDDVKFAR